MTNKEIIAILKNYKNLAFGDKDQLVSVENIIQLLSDKEPVMVLHKMQQKPQASRFDYSGNCRKCGMLLDSFYNSEYCGLCGQAVRWG